MSERPRLSSRLFLNLYGEAVPSSEELLLLSPSYHRSNQTKDTTRKPAFLPGSQSSLPISAPTTSKEVLFSLERFIGENGGKDIPSATALKIREAYKSFLSDVHGICHDSVLHSNPATTLYNICTRKQTADSSFREAVRYFGTIERLKFDQALRHALSLQSLSENVRGHANFEISVDFDFASPESKFEDILPLLGPAISDFSITANTLGKTSEQTPYIWLYEQASLHQQNHGGIFNADDLCSQIVSICKTGSNLEMSLFDLIGESNIEFLSEVIQRADVIKGIDLEFEKNHPSLLTESVLQDQKVLKSAGDWDKLTANQKKKQIYREQKQLNEAIEQSMQQSQDWLERLGFSSEYLEQERALGLQKNQRRGVETWKDNLAPDGTRVYYENRGLPAGTTRKNGNGFEEVYIPAAPKPPPPAEGELVPIDSLESWAQPAFAGTKYLNRIQSKVLSCAFYSSENMLVCAPTGAGKTNIAMLSLLQLVRPFVQPDGSIDKSGFKAIYIAPMKALAQEVVSKFSEKLNPLGLVVKEYTGDMQLSKQEIAEAQLLVCTPEKYDVSTRKGGDGSLGTLVSLIIIDEVHLLADDRGAVIEMIVARTQRYVETSQRMVRIVGLSATLPNYQDVGTFLRVNPSTGLFFFGSEFRPIPLDQTFIGITEKQRLKRNDLMTKHAYEKMVEALQRGKQVMIFVHSRKDTSRTMQSIWDLAAERGTCELLENVKHEKYGLWKRAVDKSRSQEVQQLFERGMGVHHAGMLRPDRTLSEQLFEAGLIKVLCCTATLAWGVNLPAHTVIIKGTEMYDPERGGFVDLSILDVLQIFGRAGRPQFDTSGHAILITPHESLANYLAKLSHQAPIESALIKSLPDHMNAEIVNGTINNMKEAVAWLSYTFLFIRMKRNGLVYGIRHEEALSDPQLERKRYDLVKEAATKLDNCMMSRFERRSGNLGVTDLGRIASHFYIKYTTVENFNRMLAPHISDSEAVHVLCSSTEFDSLKVRPEEMTEIDKLQKHAYTRVKVSSDDVAGKVNVLLQSYLSRARVESFTLQSDTNYVAQNAGRIARALFEICLRKGWSGLSRYYLNLCKSIDRRLCLHHSPLRQFDDVPPECAQWLEKSKATYTHLLDMSAGEIGQLIHNQKLGARVKDLVTKLPMLQVDCNVKPITKGILRLSLSITMAFDWVDRYHGFAEPFWIWIEDSDNEFIYHSEYIVLQRKDRHEAKTLEVTIPVRDPLPAQYYIRVLSDVWVGCENLVPVSFQHLLMPAMMSNVHTDLLNIHPVPISALQNADYESLYTSRFSHFNPIQSQMFHVLYHTNRNVLVGAPTGSGKTITAELAILRQHRLNPKAKTVYVAPLRALARERLVDWRNRLSCPPLNLKIVELTGEHTPSMAELWRADILIVTPEKWDSISRGWQRRGYVQSVGLVIIDEIHLLGVERGPVLEILVSRMRFISSQTGLPIRFVGLSTALANARDLGDWLGIDEQSGGALYNFRPSVRPVPMRITIQGFPGKHYCPRMATMNKPAYAAILEHSPTKPVLIFVSSRRQTRLTALDLIALCAADDNNGQSFGDNVDYGPVGNANPKRFLGSNISEEEISNIASTLKDAALQDTIVFGVGIHHAGLDNHDRSVVESLFLEQKIQVLVCTSTLAWGVNLPCHLVIIKGTEYFDGKTSQYVDMPVTDILQMLGRAGRPQFDDSAEAVVFVHEPKKHFYKKFLHEPFPVESSLHLCLHEHLNAEICGSGVIGNIVPDCIDFMTWTYYYRRLLMNPAYYGLVMDEDDEDDASSADHAHTPGSKSSHSRGGQDKVKYVPHQKRSKEITPQAVQDHLLGLIMDTLHDLVRMDCIRLLSSSSSTDDTNGNVQLKLPLPAGLAQIEAEGNIVQPGFLGKVASYYYLSYQTPFAFRTKLRSLTNSCSDEFFRSALDAEEENAFINRQHLLLRLLKILCDVLEFAEVPVRHNEEHLNEELAETLGLWPASESAFSGYLGNFESSHTKTLLMVLAHLSQAKLPISDYLNDTKTVLEQVPRVLNAMIDIAADDDQYFVTLALMQLSQLIVSRIPFLLPPSEKSNRRSNGLSTHKNGGSNKNTNNRLGRTGREVREDGGFLVSAVCYREYVDNGVGKNRVQTEPAVVVVDPERGGYKSSNTSSGDGTNQSSFANSATAVIPLRKNSQQELTLEIACLSKDSLYRKRKGTAGGKEGSYWCVVSMTSKLDKADLSSSSVAGVVDSSNDDSSAAFSHPHIVAMKRAGDFGVSMLHKARQRDRDVAKSSSNSNFVNTTEVILSVRTPEKIGSYDLCIELVSDSICNEGSLKTHLQMEVY